MTILALKFKYIFEQKLVKSHGVWKSQKKSHSTLRAKRATFTFWVKMSKMMAPTKMQIHANSCKFVQIHANSCKFMQIYANTCKWMQIHANTPRFWCKFLQILTDFDANSCKYMQIRANSCKYMQILIQIYTNT